MGCEYTYNGESFSSVEDLKERILLSGSIDAKSIAIAYQKIKSRGGSSVFTNYIDGLIYNTKINETQKTETAQTIVPTETGTGLQQRLGENKPAPVAEPPLSDQKGENKPAETPLSEQKQENEIGVDAKATFENVPIFTRTPEEVEIAKNEVFDNLNKLEIGSVIENSDGEIKVVTEKSTDKKGNQLIGVVTYERQADGSLRQLTNIVWASKSADGKIRLDYNPHTTGTNSSGEKVTVTDQITGKKIDLSKENIFTEDENGNLIQINKAEQSTPQEVKAEQPATPELKASELEAKRKDIEKRRSDELSKIPKGTGILDSISNLTGEQSNVRTEASRKIVNAVRALTGFPPYTGSLDNLFSALKEADPDYGSMIFAKLNNLDAAVQEVLKKPYAKMSGNQDNQKIIDEINAKYAEEIRVLEEQFIQETEKEQPIPEEQDNGKNDQKGRENGSQERLLTAEEDTGGEKPPVVETLPKGELTPEEKANLESIAEEVGVNFREVQNVYNKYGGGKPLSEITAKDYQAAQSKREEARVEESEPPTLPPVTVQTELSEIKKGVKSFLKNIRDRSEAVVKEVKEGMEEQLGLYYDIQGVDELEKIGQAFIEELGGMDEAVKEAKKSTSKLPPSVKVAILSAALIDTQNQVLKSEGKERAELVKKQLDIADTIDNLVRDLGRAINYIGALYAKAPLMMVAKIRQEIDKVNEIYEPKAKKKAKEVQDIIEDENTISDAANEAGDIAIGDQSEVIKQLQDELERLKKAYAKTGTKSKPFKLDVTKEDFQKALKNITSKSYSNPFLNPEFWADATTIAAYGFKQGIRKFEDMYVFLKKQFRGKYSEGYGEIYKRTRDAAIEAGESSTEFDTDEEIITKQDEITAKSDAEKLTKLTERIAKAKAKKEGNAPKMVAQRIINDAKNVLNQAETKPEQDALNKIITALVRKAQELYPEQAKVLKTSEEIIRFALENQDQSQKLFDAAQSEVENLIDNDKDLDDTQKEDLKKFLEGYKKSVFDVLLTSGQKDKIVKDALIEAGYGIERNGKIYVDWKQIVYGSKTPAKAVEKVKKLIVDKLGISESDAKPVLDALEAQLLETVKERKAAAVQSYLKTVNKYKANRLLGTKKHRTRIEKLIDLWNAGGLSESEVLNALSEEFGINAFTEENQVYIENLLTEINDAPRGAEREKLEEQLQAYIESLGRGIGYRRFQERIIGRLLSGPVTWVKNFMSTFMLTTSTLEKFVKTNLNSDALKGNIDANVVKIYKDALRIANATALDVAVNGGVDYGSAFSETTGTKEGTPRVRYTEYYKPDYKPFYASLLGKSANLNPRDAYRWLLEKEKYTGRGLSAPDTFNSIMFGELEAYSYIKRKLMIDDPTLSAREAANRAYEMMYPIPLAEARVQAEKEFDSRGIKLNFDKPKEILFKGKVIKIYPDRIRFERRVNEIVQQAREEQKGTEEVNKVSADYARRYTFKQVEPGIMKPIVAIAIWLKTGSKTLTAKLRNSSQDAQTKALNNKTADVLDTVSETLWTAILPYVKGPGAIIEKGLELVPTYGFTKGGVALTAAGYFKLTGNKEKAEESFSRAGEYAVRATVGLLLLSLLRSLADDDEDKLPAIYGEGAAYGMKATQKTRPENTIIVDGRKIPFDLFGTLGVALKLEATNYDILRYQKDKFDKMNPAEREAMKTMLYAGAIINSSYTEGLSELKKFITDPASRSSSRYARNKSSELLTRSTIPFTSAFRQGNQVLEELVKGEPAKKATTFPEALAKYSGLVGGWALDRPAFDYRGRTYNTYDLYPNSPTGWLTMASKKMNVDAVDRFLTKINYELRDPSVNNTKYWVPTSEGVRAQTDTEYYDFMLKKGKLFNSYISQLYESNKGVDITDESMVAALKKEIGKANTMALKESYEETFGRDAFTLMFPDEAMTPREKRIKNREKRVEKRRIEKGIVTLEELL